MNESISLQRAQSRVQSRGLLMRMLYMSEKHRAIVLYRDDVEKNVHYEKAVIDGF
jgi:hypothetical protein